MKRFFASIGKALVYLLIFLGMQLLIPLIYGIAQAAAALRGGGSLAAASSALMDNLLLLTLLSNLFTILIFCLTAPMRRRSLRTHLYLTPMDRRGILPLVLLGVCANVVLLLLLSLIPFPEEWLASYESSAAMLDTGFSLVSLLAIAIVSPIAEEMAFRGLIFTRLRSGMPQIAAALASAAIFGLCHGSLIWFLYAFPLGLVMTWLFLRFQSLWASILFHVSLNTANVLLSLLPEDSGGIFLLLIAVSCVGVVLCAIWIVRITRPSPVQTSRPDALS